MSLTLSMRPWRIDFGPTRSWRVCFVCGAVFAGIAALTLVGLTTETDEVTIAVILGVLAVLSLVRGRLLRRQETRRRGRQGRRHKW